MNASSSTLDHHGRMAMAWWTTHQPQHLHRSPEPIRFCQRISVAVQAQIDETQADLQGELPSNRNYLDQAAAVTRTRMRAEELVLDEWFPSEGGPGRLPD